MKRNNTVSIKSVVEPTTYKISRGGTYIYVKKDNNNNWNIVPPREGDLSFMFIGYKNRKDLKTATIVVEVMRDAIKLLKSLLDEEERREFDKVFEDMF